MFRNWIEKALKKRIAGAPVYVGRKGGRKIYAVMFEDGAEQDFYIDHERKEIEPY